MDDSQVVRSYFALNGISNLTPLFLLYEYAGREPSPEPGASKMPKEAYRKVERAELWLYGFEAAANSAIRTGLRAFPGSSGSL